LGEKKVIEEIGVKEIYGHISFVYKIYLEHSFVYMRVDKTPYYNSERYIVIVDSNKFYKEWTGKTVGHCVIDDDWEFRKYEDAKVGFSKGIIDPVPVAQIGYSDVVSFTDGITRTKLLIRNGALCFPVECSRKSAKNLYKKLSYKNTKIQNVFGLFKKTIL